MRIFNQYVSYIFLLSIIFYCIFNVTLTIAANLDWYLNTNQLNLATNNLEINQQRHDKASTSSIGLGGGYYLTDQLSIDLLYSQYSFDLDGAKLDVDKLFVDLKYYFYSKYEQWQSYASLGVCMIQDMCVSDSYAQDENNVGIGIQYAFMPPFQLVGGITLIYDHSNSNINNIFAIGVQYDIAQQATGIKIAIADNPVLALPVVAQKEKNIPFLQDSAIKIMYRQNSYHIDTYDNTNLSELLEVLSDNPQLNILIEGFASSEGSIEINQLISEKRAQSAHKKIFGHLNIPISRFNIVGYGEKFADQDQALAADRYVNIKLQER